MLVVYEIRDDMMSEDQAMGLVQKSFWWDLAVKWTLGPGTIDNNVITSPIPDVEPEEGPDVQPT